jgi:hypothetical protein
VSVPSHMVAVVVSSCLDSTPTLPVDHVRVSVGIGHRNLPALVCALARRRALVVESFFSLRVLRSSSCALIRLCASANVMAACFYARNTKLTTLLSPS